MAAAVNLLRKSFKLKRPVVPLLVPKGEEQVDSPVDFAEAFLKGEAVKSVTVQCKVVNSYWILYQLARPYRGSPH